MKSILNIFFFIVTFTNSNCFVITKDIMHHNHHNNNIIHKNYKMIKNNNNKIELSSIKKINAYKQLMRTTNILPTFLLNILGGWLTIPSYNLFLNKFFWIFSMITQLTMMNSMVINDLFDLKIDLINNNNRPLITKQITIKEARCLYITINFLIFLSTTYFLKKNNIHLYIYGINLVLFLYTPVLKKILFVKNIVCASVVSSTIILTSKSLLVGNNKNLLLNYIPSQYPIIKYNNLNLIHITSIFLFLSSMYIELLLDIKDIDGDRENNIITIPNYFGVKNTLDFLLMIFSSNLMYFSNIFYENNNYAFLLGFIFSNGSFIKNLLVLRLSLLNNDTHSYERIKEKISSVVKETTIPLFIFIITTILYS